MANKRNCFLYAVRLTAVAMVAAVSTVGFTQQAEPVADRDVRMRINPNPRAELSREAVLSWQFEELMSGWLAVNHIRSAEVYRGVLAVESTSYDPYLFGPPIRLEVDGKLEVRLRMRSHTAGDGQIFWATVDEPNFNEANSSRFTMQHDGEWHEYLVPISPQGTLTRLRLDPGQAAGRTDIAEIEVHRVELHPLEIAWIETDQREITVWVRYHGDQPADVTATVAYQFDATEEHLERSKSLDGPQQWQARFELPDRQSPVARIDITASSTDIEPIRRHIWLHREDVPTPGSWLTIGGPQLTLRLHPRGLFARIYRHGERVGSIGPLVMLDNGDSVAMEVTVDGTGQAATLVGEVARVELRVHGRYLHASVEAEQPVEALITRVLGGLEQGLLPGVEYLGAGEWSSSRADIETEEHIRFAPPPPQVTMPLLGVVTDRVSLGLLYDRPEENAPRLASPNFFDGAADHRLSLHGSRIEAVYRIDAGWDQQRLEDLILWSVQTRGLPDVPPPPRTTDQQYQLALHALQGVLREQDGWGHCVEPNWTRRFYSDLASTTWRLTGELPELPELVRGGAHLPDDASFLITGRGQRWLEHIDRQAAAVRQEQQPDGSFRYRGRYARTHFEDTASGYNAQRAVTLLTHAWYTGNETSLEAGVMALEYMKRFRTPRGAQTWEMPLHTPDILAAAHLVRAYMLGYQLTEEAQYLDLARRWAISGLPFVYQWQLDEGRTMPYAVIAVKGATNWVAPNWIGLPVQWCGLPYADALLMLAEHDPSFDWRQVAEGILVCAEQMMYDEGDLAGTLPDFYFLESGQRGGPSINPSALVSLRRRVEGQLSNVAVATFQNRRVVSPFPVTIEDNMARVEAEPGQVYQVVIDGQRVIDIRSRGIDELPLD